MRKANAKEQALYARQLRGPLRSPATVGRLVRASRSPPGKQARATRAPPIPGQEAARLVAALSGRARGIQAERAWVADPHRRHVEAVAEEAARPYRRCACRTEQARRNASERKKARGENAPSQGALAPGAPGSCCRPESRRAQGQ